MTLIAQQKALADYPQYRFAPVVEVRSPSGGTYYVNPAAGTCTCLGFVNRQSCRHLLQVDRWITEERNRPAPRISAEQMRNDWGSDDE